MARRMNLADLLIGQLVGQPEATGDDSLLAALMSGGEAMTYGGDRFRRQRAGMLESPVDKMGRMPRYDPRSPWTPVPGPNRSGAYRTRRPLPPERWRA